ncbi:MAG: tyrosinase family protein, partial [Proteobacteria bacterium]
NECPHNGWFFLPWHRTYLHHFELVCRAFCDDDSFSLPYWDWSTDSRLPEEFDVGEEATNPLCNKSRAIQNRSEIKTEEITREYIRKILATADFASFGGTPSTNPRWMTDTDVEGGSGALEAGPHNKIHVFVSGDMETFLSPRDPIFWLHHCNVDRLWQAWVSQLGANLLVSLPPEENLDNKDLTLNYWKNFTLKGFYKTEKVDGKFTAAPAGMLISSLLDPLDMGLLYVAPAASKDSAAEAYPASSDLPVAPVDGKTIPGTTVTETLLPKESTAQAPDDKVKPIEIDPSQVNLPLLETKKTAKRRFKGVVKAAIAFHPKVKESFGLTESALGVKVIAGSAELESVLRKAASKQWTTATLRLKIAGIPFPVDPQAEIQIYLNASTATGKSSNPSYITSVSFFGHHHKGQSIATNRDILSTVKALVKAGKSPFGNVAQLGLTFTAVWDRKSEKTSLETLTYSLDYLETIG